MISREEAYRIVMENSMTTGTTTTSIEHSLGRVLREDIISDTDMPPFNRSAVDGYACRREDLGNELEIIETIRAGSLPALKPGKNQCSKIMTGAIVPDGCDFVFMVEYSRIMPSGRVIFTDTPFKPNISLRGEDVREGDIILKSGKLINPQDIGVMAAVGHTIVKVALKPAVGIISTGDELVEPLIKPSGASVRNSNASQLIAQVTNSGASARYYGIAPDSEEITLAMIEKAKSENDILLLTGGVSMGDYDFVPKVLDRSGFRILFSQINVQPGKPTAFGIQRTCAAFGLPGNPVSAFVQFETLVRPMIYRMMGHDWRPLTRYVRMAVRFERKAAGRAAWVPVIITGSNEAMPVEYHGSAHIAAFPYADGIASVEPGKNIIEKGEIISVRQI